MLKEKINQILSELSLTDEPINGTLILKDDLGFDSLRIVELIITLEENLAIEIDESDLDPNKLNAVSDLYVLIEKYAAVI